LLVIFSRLEDPTLGRIIRRPEDPTLGRIIRNPEDPTLSRIIRPLTFFCQDFQENLNKAYSPPSRPSVGPFNWYQSLIP
jgi:hypothetical protein